MARRVVAGFQTEPPRTARLATFRDAAGETIDRGLYTVFPAPASYTGEDMVEFSCHGGLLAPATLLAALHEAGARPAAPGEFTRRAVLNGKLDILQAEATADLIAAGSRAAQRVALHHRSRHPRHGDRADELLDRRPLHIGHRIVSIRLRQKADPTSSTARMIASRIPISGSMNLK